MVDLNHTIAVVFHWDTAIIHLADTRSVHTVPGNKGLSLCASYCGDAGVVHDWKFTPHIPSMLMDGGELCPACGDLMAKAQVLVVEEIPF